MIMGLLVIMTSAIDVRARQTTFLFIEFFSYCCLLPRDSCLFSLDHLIRSHQHVRRDRQADLLGGFQVDHQLELRRLLDGKIGGLRAFQNLVYIRSSAPVQVGYTHAIGHEPTVFHVPPIGENRWQSALYCKFCNLWSLRNEDGPRQHDDCVSTPLTCGSERSLNTVGSLYVQE